MFEFGWLWAWFALPLPWLIRFLLKPTPTHNQSALKTSFINDFTYKEQKIGFRIRTSHPLMLWIALLAWTLLILAASRPQWIDEMTEVTVSGRDLMLAMDISGSMQTDDFVVSNRRISRLEIAKSVATDFIKKRQGDRIGLIVFGTQPYLQMPLSFDIETVQKMLNTSFIGLAGKESTAIGDAIGLAIKRLREYTKSNKVLILLTDGVNNAGNLNPLSAAEIAAEEGMKIYTIGIGTNQRRGFFVRRSELDEQTLKNIAQKTGGRYFRAKNTNELIQIYNILDQLEVIEREQKTLRLYTELYPYPLTLAGLIAFCMLLTSALQGRFRWIS